jgi:glycosyltransferase involved in cell wall biosynthesis
MLAWLKARVQAAAVFLARSLDVFLVWLFESRDPAIVFLRESIRKSRFLMLGARAFIRCVRALPTLQRKIRETFKPLSLRRLQSITAARAVGGGITAAELEQIWLTARPGSHVLVIAEGPELEQIGIVLAAISAKAIGGGSLAAGAIENLDIGRFDLIIAAPLTNPAPWIMGLTEQAQKLERLLCVGNTAKRSDYFVSRPRETMVREATEGKRRPLREKIARGEPLRVVFLNDVGFQYGAGVALKRQVASLLLRGWEVAVVSWLPGDLLEPPTVTGVSHFAGWRGVHNVNAIHASKGLNPGEIISGLTTRIAAFDPDVVITGNLHGAGWPLPVLTALRSRGTEVVAFMHDTYFVTGRCAQPMNCGLYRTGCDASCPTPNEYPRLAPELIGPAWRERGEIFAGARPVPLIGNSEWTQNIALQRFGSSAVTGMVHLALDHELFAPIPKATARRLLGIPDDKPILALGAVDVHNQWKGGPLFHGFHKAIVERNDVGLILFGRSSETLDCLKSFGLVVDERMMPLILNAADIFISTATAESFGQSLLEASACGLPVVAFDVGGVSDVVVHNETGILVKQRSVENLLEAVDRLIARPAEREALGRAGRTRVLNTFTLLSQGEAWVDCLKGIC